MTSGNLSEEPIAYRDDDALERLGGHRRSLPGARPRDRVALRRFRGPRHRRTPRRLPALPGLRAPRRSRAAAVRAPGARLRGSPEEHVLHRPRRHAPSSAPTSETSRASRPSSAFEEAIERAERFLERPARDRRARPPSALRLDALRAGTAGGGEGRASSTTTPTWRAPWPSTGSRARSWASPSTARDTEPTARPGAARSCSRPPTGFERLGDAPPDRAARRRPRRSARSGASRSRCSTTRSTAILPSTPSPSFREVPARRLELVRQMVLRRHPGAPFPRRRPVLRRAGLPLPLAARLALRGPGRPRVELRRRRPRARRLSLRARRGRGRADARPAPARPGRDGRLPRRGGALRDLGPVPQHPRRSDGGAGPGRGRNGRGALPVVLTGGCFQNALLDRAGPRRARRPSSRSTGTAKCRPATAASPSARRSSPPRSRAGAKEVPDVPRSSRPRALGRRPDGHRRLLGDPPPGAARRRRPGRSRRATTSSTTWASRSAGSRPKRSARRSPSTRPCSPRRARTTSWPRTCGAKSSGTAPEGRDDPA